MEKTPIEIPAPDERPVKKPAEEPPPQVWPRREPEILPGKDPKTTPLPPEIPIKPTEDDTERFRDLRLFS